MGTTVLRGEQPDTLLDLGWHGRLPTGLWRTIHAGRSTWPAAADLPSGLFLAKRQAGSSRGLSCRRPPQCIDAARAGNARRETGVHGSVHTPRTVEHSS